MEIIKSDIKNNHATNCGGGIVINAGSMLINNSQIEANQADICGGGLYLNGDGSVKSFGAYYVNNSANMYGGGLSLSSRNFIFNNDVIKHNYATQYGGGYYLTICPINKSENIEINNNFASISGGGYFIEHDSKCEWATFAELINNRATFGNNFATFPDHIQFIWNIPDEFKRSDELYIKAILQNGFNETVSVLSDNDIFIMRVVYNTSIGTYFNDFESIGGDIAEFNGAETVISFVIKPKETSHIFKKDIIISFIFNVTVSLNGKLFKESKSANFVDKLYAISTSTKIISHIMNGICSFCIIITAICFVILWHQPIIKGSRVPFMLIILLGLEIISILISYGMVEAHRGGCGAYIGTLVIGLVVILAPISAKTWAIYHVFAYAEDLKDFMWTNIRLFLAFVLIPMVLTIIYVIIWIILDNGMIEVGYYYNTDYEYLATYCPFDYNFVMIPFIILFLSLILLSFLTLRARHVPQNYNEAKYLGLCIFTFIVLLFMWMLITFTYFLDDSSKWLLRSLCGFVLIQSVLGYLFYYKLFIVWQGKEEGPTFNKTHSVFINEMEANSRKSSNKTNSIDGDNKNKNKIKMRMLSNSKSPSLNKYEKVDEMEEKSNDDNKINKQMSYVDDNKENIMNSDDKLVHAFVTALELQTLKDSENKDGDSNLQLSMSTVFSPQSHQSTAL